MKSLVLLLLGIGLQWYWVGRSGGKTDRTITVSGTATIQAVPDKYVFYPQYESDSTDTATAQKQVSDKTAVVVAKLKELGVPTDGIAVSQSTYDAYNGDSVSKTTSASVTITVDSYEVAQKVQDYLMTTSAVGQLTPQASFGEEKRKTLERDGRAKATDDAKANASQNAAQLGVKLGKVVSISDSSYGGVYPMMGMAEDVKAISASGTVSSGASSSVNLSVQPGLNELTYSVSVVYAIK